MRKYLLIIAIAASALYARGALALTAPDYLWTLNTSQEFASSSFTMTPNTGSIASASTTRYDWPLNGTVATTSLFGTGYFISGAGNGYRIGYPYAYATPNTIYLPAGHPFTILYQWRSDKVNGVLWDFGSNNCQLQSYAGGLYWNQGPISGGTLTADHAWHQVIARSDGANAALYLDGSLVGTHAVVGDCGTTGIDNFIIGNYGGNNGGSDNSVGGVVDAMAIWNSDIGSGGVTSAWNSGAMCDIQPNGSCSSAVPFSLSFDFPVYGSTVRDFYQWTLHSPTTIPGTIQIFYGDSPTHLYLSDPIHDFSYLASSSYPNTYNLTKNILLNPIVNLYATSTWYAEAVFTDTSGHITTTTTAFIIDPNSSTTNAADNQRFLQGTISNFGQGQNPSSTASWQYGIDCSAFSGSVNWDGITCNLKKFFFAVGQFFFQPDPLFSNYLNSSIAGYRTLLPFSIIFQLNGTIATALQPLQATSTTNYDLYIPVFGGRAAILTSSTLEDLVGSTTKRYVFNVQDAFFYVGAALLGYSMIFL